MYIIYTSNCYHVYKPFKTDHGNNTAISGSKCSQPYSEYPGSSAKKELNTLCSPPWEASQVAYDNRVTPSGDSHTTTVPTPSRQIQWTQMQESHQLTATHQSYDRHQLTGSPVHSISRFLRTFDRRWWAGVSLHSSVTETCDNRGV